MSECKSAIAGSGVEAGRGVRAVCPFKIVGCRELVEISFCPKIFVLKCQIWGCKTWPFGVI